MSSIAIQTLGHFAIRCDGAELPVPPTAKARALLAYLAMHPGVEHARERLAELLWPESEPERSRARLSTIVWSIRKSFERLGDGDECLRAKKATIAWVAPVDVDAAAFETLARSDDGLDVRKAVELYGGDFLEGDYDEWTVGERERLSGIYEGALERMLDGAASVKIASALLQRNPYHERAYHALIADALRNGRVPLARAIFGRARTALGELGESIRAEFEARYPALARARTIVTPGLPVPVTSLVGRADDVERVLGMLSSARLVTVTGPGGVGKTRVALEAARHCAQAVADGVFSIELAQTRRPGMVATTIAAALRVAAPSSRALVDAIVEAYRDKAFLLLIDNCEHVLAECGGVLDALLHAIPGLVVVATSREPLGVAGEEVYRLSALPLADAIKLFLQRAPANANLPASRGTNEAVAAVVERLDRLPLAIELAAARADALAPAQLIDALERRLNVLEAGRRAVPQRHRTLDALIAWSYGLLSESQRAFVRRCSAFAGGFSARAAAAICALDAPAAAQALPALASLAHKSLLQAERRAGSDEHLYVMLETVRDFAGEKAEEAGETAALVAAHTGYYAALAEGIAAKLAGTDREAIVAELAAEWGNVTLALGRLLDGADVVRGRSIAVDLSRFWIETGRWVEGRYWIDRAIAVDAPMEDPARFKLLYASARLVTSLGDFAELRRLANEMLVVGERSGDVPGVARALNALGNASFYFGNGTEAVEFFEQALVKYEEAGEADGVAVSLLNLGAAVLDYDGDCDRARGYLERSLAGLRGLGPSVNLGIVLGNLARIDIHEHKFESALEYARESVHEFERLGNRTSAAGQCVNIALAQLGLENAGAAAATLRDAFDALKATVSVTYLVNYIDAWMAVACEAGAFERAAWLHGFGEAYRTKSQLRVLADEKHGWRVAWVERLKAALEPQRRERVEAQGAAASFAEAEEVLRAVEEAARKTAAD